MLVLVEVDVREGDSRASATSSSSSCMAVVVRARFDLVADAEDMILAIARSLYDNRGIGAADDVSGPTATVASRSRDCRLYSSSTSIVEGAGPPTARNNERDRIRVSVCSPEADRLIP